MDAAPRSVARATAARVVVPQRVLVEGLTALAGAGDRPEVAEAVLPMLLELPGVRAVAVVERSGAAVVVQGSAGYDCGRWRPEPASRWTPGSRSPRPSAPTAP